MARSVLSPLVTLLLAVTALPAAAADRWSLESAVPSGVFFYEHNVANPENEFLDDYWNEVFTAFANSGIDRDIKSMLLGFMPKDDRERFENLWTRAAELCETVAWRELIATEFVFAQEFTFPTPSYLFLSRSDGPTAEKNAAGLKAILQTIAAAINGESCEECRVAESEFAGAKLWSLECSSAAPLVLARKGGILALSLQIAHVKIEKDGETVQYRTADASSLLERSLKLLDGDKSVGRLIDQPNYKAAMAALPEPENVKFFFDANRLLHSLDQGIASIGDVIRESELAEVEPKLRVIRRIINHLEFVDSFASVQITEGFSTHEYKVTTFAPDAADKPLFAAFCGKPTIERFDRFIPKEATGFSVTSGIDPLKIYRTALKFIEEDVPEGQDLLAKWNDLQDEIDFHVERDLLSWIGTEFISITMPPAVPSLFGGSDTVMLVRVRDVEKARQTVDRGVAALSSFLAGTSQSLTTQPAASQDLHGFKTLIHPAAMMFIRPVYGFSDQYLIVATSEKAILRCLKTARGEHQSIRANKRFAKEGILPKGAVNSISFTDKSRMGQELAQALGMLGMFGGFVPTNNDSARVIRPILVMAQKLAPVVAKLNFYKSQACVSTFDGKIYRSQTVTHYKEPPPPVEIAEQHDQNTEAAADQNRDKTASATRK